MSDLYDNAIGSIKVGMADYQSNDQHRLLAAIRNVHAGILLLCKEKLRRLSPPGSDEVLLKQKIKPTTTSAGIQFKGSGKKTVDQQQIRDRFGDLGVSLQWARLQDISNIRNNAEHYYFSGNKSQIRQAMADACVLIRQLIVDVLDDEPVSALGSDTWNALLEIKEVFDTELAACKASMANVDWALAGTARAAEEFQCPKCSSRLLRQDDPANTSIENVSLRCSSCAAQPDTADVIEAALDEAFAGEAHVAVKDGGEGPVQGCPECYRESYIVEEGACACCQFSMPTDATCAVCGNYLTLADYAENTALCSYHANSALKD